jgi:PKD repeat protein
MKSYKEWLLFILFILLASSACKKNEPVPTAGFSYQANNNFKIPCNVIFTNLSTNAFSYDWDFGDNHSSTAKDPSHTYLKAGNFTVILKAYTESRYQWASKSEVISIKDTV